MADKTLDDIIKQKRADRFNLAKTQPKKGNQNQKRGQNQNQNRGQNQNQNQNQNRGQNLGKNVNKKGRLFKEVQKDLGIKTANKPVSINTDARNKIIQKQRIKFTDARDRLAHMAKQGDARDRINKIRKIKPGEKVVPQQKKTVVKKKILNVPRQTFHVGGQTRMRGAAVLRTVAGANPKRRQQQQQQHHQQQQQVNVNKPMNQMRRPGMVTKGNRQAGRSYPLANNPGVFTIKNNNMQAYDDDDTYEIVDYRQELQRAQHFGGGMGIPTAMDTMVMRPEPVMRSRPAENEIYERDYDTEVRPSRLRITAANSDYRVGGQQYAEEWQPQVWEQPMRVQQRKRPYYSDEVDYQQVYPKKVTTMAAPQVQSESGTKVVVSNLHPCVSVEDMEELFGTVGSVLVVRMVRPGTAEAIFVTQEDAYRSVELFNNRQLDGQPMKVMVVRKKAPMVTTSSVQARSVLRNARGRSGYYVQ